MIFGDDDSSLQELALAVQMKLPVIIVEGSELCNKIIGYIVHRVSFYNKGKFCWEWLENLK
jgi:hypothetical protein